MLDELLGRAELKERIDSLEDENHHLERRVEAEEERRAEAVTERQTAEEQVNRLENRIVELEDRVERLREDEESVEFRGTETLHGDRVDEVVARLGSFETGPEGALTAMVDDDLPEAVGEAFGDHGSLVARAAPCLAVTDDAGLVSAALVAADIRPNRSFRGAMASSSSRRGSARRVGSRSRSSVPTCSPSASTMAGNACP